MFYELFCRQNANSGGNVNTDDQTDCDPSNIDSTSASISGSRTYSDKNQRTIGDCFSGLTDKIKTQMCKKMEIAYFVGKNELPFTMYEAIVELESKHGVDLSVAYTNRKQCSEFVDLHGDHIRQNLKANLKKAKFICILTGSTDTSVKEKKSYTYIFYQRKVVTK
ncbi:hypothetical protein LOTGIDRAFT_160960 [Lottia gigantea]|uniref:Uncharacterized protein n=1 Tax=Lottia gigantea TaxID=225164 RepID=V4ACZ5_LOTGI|nr:hypothetical protein LOTGIDRAFT_160960 [Lottia gigantea]ESO94727.1 hypothetical protein LOTGIDRAFT_160960 [Lottia gigantea]